MEKLDTKTRKKAFEQFFKTVIIPFCAQEGFSHVSKTTKKLYKKFSDGLSVYIYFEYNTFGSGFYDVAVSYFDEEVGSETDDEYIAMPKISTPPTPLAKALTLFSQLFGFFISSIAFLSYSVASPISCSNFINTPYKYFTFYKCPTLLLIILS